MVCKIKENFGKPIYIGFSVLDLSKLLIYWFCFGNHEIWHRLKFSYMDTDKEGRKGTNKVIKEHADDSSTSEYNKDHKCY